MLEARGPIRGGALGQLLFPTSKRVPQLGATLGKLRRAGLVGWSPYRLEYFVIPNHGVLIEERS